MKDSQQNIKNLLKDLQKTPPIIPIKKRTSPISVTEKSIKKTFSAKSKIILSERQLEIAKLLEKGLRNKDISEKLNIIPKTVSTQINRIKEKAGIKKDLNTYRLIIILKDKGLL